MKSCESCPVAPDAECLGTRPEFGFFCDLAATGEPTKLAHVRNRSALASGAPAPANPAPFPSLPLAGDLVALATKRLGADRLARWVAAKLGADCGCEARRQILNTLDAALRRYLGLFTTKDHNA